jgi:hemerythrin-like domain-containing protein
MERNSTLQPLLNHLVTERQISTDLLGHFMSGKNRRTVKTAIVNFWKNHLQRHIDAEEKGLLPFLVQHHFDRQCITLLHREHETMQVLADRLQKEPDSDYLYEAFVKLAHQHLLFEDKVLLVRMEETIPAPELAQLRLVA